MSHQAELLDSKFLEPQSPKRVFIYFHIGIEIRLALLQAMLIERHFGAKISADTRLAYNIHKFVLQIALYNIQTLEARCKATMNPER